MQDEGFSATLLTGPGLLLPFRSCFLNVFCDDAAMHVTPIIEMLQAAPRNGNQPLRVELSRHDTLEVYPKSLQ